MLAGDVDAPKNVVVVADDLESVDGLGVYAGHDKLSVIVAGEKVDLTTTASQQLDTIDGAVLAPVQPMAHVPGLTEM